MYYRQAKKRQILISDKPIWLDSRQEETLIRWLEAKWV